MRIAIVGAESTGKSTLASALATRLKQEFGVRTLTVSEVLREWCDAQGRTPRRDEQLNIAQTQQARIDEAAHCAEVVLCDTTPLMTAVYSDIVFGDHSLDELARRSHTCVTLTLLTALDLPWVADGLQRDGPHVREPVDQQIRRRLLNWGAEWSVVAGSGEARTDHAMAALRPVLQRRAEQQAAQSGLFSRLLETRYGPAPAAWRCERCDDPQCEHRLRRKL